MYVSYMSHTSIILNCLKSLAFSKKNFFFLLLYKDGKTKLLKRKYSKKILKKYEKKPISKGKE